MNFNCIVGSVVPMAVGREQLHLATPSPAAPRPPWTPTPSWRWSMAPPPGSQLSHTLVFQATRTKVTFHIFSLTISK